MATYVVSYDLNTPGQKYSELKDLIDSISINWCRPLSSFYIVKTNLTTNQFKERMRSVLDDNDTFIVIECSDNYSGWLVEDIWNHLRNHIF